MHRAFGIDLTDEENPGNPELGDCLINAVRPVVASNEVPYLQNTWQVRTACQGERRKRKKERMGTGEVEFPMRRTKMNEPI